MNLRVDGIDQGVMQISPDLRVAEEDVGANVTCVSASDGCCAAGLGDGRVLKVFGSQIQELGRHDGAVTGVVLASDGIVLSAGQDGVLRRDGTAVFSTPGGHWITDLAVSHDGQIALATGRSAIVLTSDGALRARFDDHPSTVSGVALSPDGTRLAASRYNGITIHALGDLSEPLELTWRGSMVSVSWSQDGRYVVGATQDRELHIWDLVTNRDFRLGGYNRKVRQIGWSDDGNFLISTGADVVVAWPLAGDPGAMPPVEIGFAYAATVSAVPQAVKSDRMAAGFTNGTVIIGETAKGTAKIGRKADGDTVTAIDWDMTSGAAVFGTASGKLGVVRAL